MSDSHEGNLAKEIIIQRQSHVSADVALSLRKGSNLADLKFKYYLQGVLLSLALHWLPRDVQLRLDARAVDIRHMVTCLCFWREQGKPHFLYCYNNIINDGINIQKVNKNVKMLKFCILLLKDYFLYVINCMCIFVCITPEKNNQG